MENLQFQEISQLPTTEDDSNTFAVVSHEEGGVNTAKKYPLLRKANQEQVNGIDQRLSVIEDRSKHDKGYFTTESSLLTLETSPNPGDFANVAGMQYACEVKGIWINTGNPAPIPELDLKMLEPLKTTEPATPAFDFSTILDQGFYEVYNNKVRVSALIPASYKHIKLAVPLDRKMRVTLKPRGSAVHSAIYTDINDNYINHEINGNDSDTIYENYDLNIPSNAVYIYLSGHVSFTLKAYVNGLDVVSLSEFNAYINKTGFETLNIGISGDSITSDPGSWAYILFNTLKFANFHNEAVGSSCWSKRRIVYNNITYETQDYEDPNFAGISSDYGVVPNEVEAQKRANNCSVVHIQKFIKEVTNGNYPVPNIMVLSYGTNGEISNGNAETALAGKDLSSVDLFTMAGAVRWCSQTLLTAYPSLKLFIALPIQRANPTDNVGLITKIDIIKGVCNGMSVEYFDCYNKSGICEKFEVIGGVGRDLSDGVHPGNSGKSKQGNFIINEVKKRY